MRCLIFLSALVVASLAFQPPTFEKPDESDFLTNLHNIIEKEKEFLHNLFGGGQTKTKRNIFGKIGNFFKDHVAEIIKVAEIAGPLVVGKRETNDFLTNIHNIIEKEKQFLHNLFGGNALGKREESDFLTNLHNIIEKEKEFLHNLFGGAQNKGKRNIFGKIGNFFKDHVAEIIKVAEIAGPLVVGKREETDDFLTNLKNIIEKEKEFLHNLFGGGQTKAKRNIFGKIGNFFKDHVAEIIKVAEIAGPLVVGKREANDFLTNIHNIIEKEKEFLHNLFGGANSLGKREESDFLTNLHNIIEKEKEFLHNLFGGGQTKTKRNIFGKIGNFFKDHVAEIIKVAEIAGPLVVGKREETDDFLTNLHNIIEKEKEFLHNLFGGGQTKTKRNIFGKIGNFFKDHVAEIIKVAEIAGPLVVGKREANDFLTNIHNIIEKEKEFLHNLFGGVKSLGKRDESDFLTNLHNIIEKEKEFLHNLFGGGQTKTKRNIFGKIGNFFKDHVAEIIKVAEIAGPLVVGKREETDDFLTNLHNIIEKEKEFLHNLFGGGQTKTKRNIFGKIGNFFKDHVAEIIKVAEIAGPLVVGKREANDFLTNIHNIIEKEKEFLHNLFGGVKSLGKRDESDFLTNLHNIIEKEKEFLHNLFGGGQTKTKRNIFGKIGNFFKDHVAEIIKVAEIAGPLVVGKREETDDFLTNLHNIIEKEKEFLHNLFGGGQTKTKRNIFGKIGNFFKDHVAEIIKVAEIAGPLVVGKREANDFLTNIHNIIEKEKEFLHNLFGGVKSLGKRDESDFLTNLHNIIEKEKEFLHNLFGGGQKTKRNIFGKIGNFFKDHVGDIIKVAEIAGPLVIGKREETDDFLTNIHNIIEKEKEFLHNLFGGAGDESDLPLFEKPLTHTQIMSLIKQHMV